MICNVTNTLNIWLGALHMLLTAFSQFIEAHGTDLSVGVRVLGAEPLLRTPLVIDGT